MSSTVSAVARGWFQSVWNERSPESIDRYLAPGAPIHGPEGDGETIVGPEAFRKFHTQIITAFSGIHIGVEEVIESGPLVAVRWIARMTHSGEGLGVPPTGKTVTVPGMSFMRVENGQITEGWSAWDKGQFLAELGVLVPVA